VPQQEKERRVGEGEKKDTIGSSPTIFGNEGGEGTIRKKGEKIPRMADIVGKPRKGILSGDETRIFRTIGEGAVSRTGEMKKVSITGGGEEIIFGAGGAAGSKFLANRTPEKREDSRGKNLPRKEETWHSPSCYARGTDLWKRSAIKTENRLTSAGDPSSGKQQGAGELFEKHKPKKMFSR